MRFGVSACVGPVVRRLRFGDRLVDSLDLFGRGLGFRGRRLRRALGLDPARVEQPRFDRADLVGQLAIAFGGARLAPQLRGALLLVAEDFAEPREIGFGRAQLLLGILAPRVKPGNARRLLEQQPPLDRLGGDDRADLALADERRRVGAGRRIGEQQGDVLGADVAAVDPIGGAGAALDPPGDLAFAGAALVACDRARAGSRLRRSRAAGAIAVPAKITSSMPPPRSDLGLDSPIAQRIASSRFDLPQPLGPTTPVRPGSIRSSAGSTKLLKPLSLSRRILNLCALPLRQPQPPARLEQRLQRLPGRTRRSSLPLIRKVGVP